MADLLLVIGNKNDSSWSLRPWMLLKHVGLPFDELVLPLDSAQFKTEIAKYSPTRRVPVLIDGQTRVWESTAICEYAVEKAGGRGLPADAAARAKARSAAAEMHAGFTGIRAAYPMDVRARGKRSVVTPELQSSIQRLDELWRECRAEHHGSGPWLFGDYSIADAMFAPIALRFNTYGLDGLGDVSRAYVGHVLADAALQDWMKAAASESRIGD